MVTTKAIINSSIINVEVALIAGRIFLTKLDVSSSGR
jgi:hypothetical protein